MSAEYGRFLSALLMDAIHPQCIAQIKWRENGKNLMNGSEISILGRTFFSIRDARMVTFPVRIKHFSMLN